MSGSDKEIEVPCCAPLAFEPPALPDRTGATGTWCRLEPLDPAAHGNDLWEAMQVDGADASWTFLGYGPFAGQAAMTDKLAELAARTDAVFLAVCDGDAGGAVRGWASLMSVVPDHGRIEIGNVWFSPALQRRRAGTEALVLLAKRVFDLGYRRLEWKCDAANTASRAAAQRLGYVYEGIHRRHMVVKGRNRDTAWFSMIAEEWPRIEAACDAWLQPSNFDAAGRQKTRLSALTRA